MLWLVATGLAAPCAAPTDIDAVLEGLIAVEMALRDADMAVARIHAQALEQTVLCVEEPLPRIIRPRLYRAIGAPREPGVRQVWWEQAHEMDPGFHYGIQEVPVSILDAWEEAFPPQPPRSPPPRSTPRGPKPVQGPVEFLAYPRPREKDPLMLGGAVAIIGGGVLVGLGIRQRTLANRPGSDDADERRKQATVLTVSGVALGGLGAGAATWGLVIDDPGVRWTVRW